jgi:hypothetical protein
MTQPLGSIRKQKFPKPHIGQVRALRYPLVRTSQLSHAEVEGIVKRLKQRWLDHPVHHVREGNPAWCFACVEGQS